MKKVFSKRAKVYRHSYLNISIYKIMITPDTTSINVITSHSKKKIVKY